MCDSLSAMRRHSSSIKAWFDSWLRQTCLRTDNIQKGSGTHSASNPVGNGEPFLGVKRSECEAGHLLPSGAKVNKCVRSDTRVGTLIVATIYLQLIQNRYMLRSFTVLHCSHQHCVQSVASDVEVVGYL